jgi:Fur family peroxide stress response transcriptional regulator
MSEREDENIIRSIQYLKKMGYRITPQRIAVMKALSKSKNHPSAEEIYKEVIEKFPKISIATIYNVLTVLKKENLIKTIRINDETNRYDYDLSVHAHFLCKECSRVYDVDIEEKIISDIIKGNILLKNSIIDGTEIMIKGICPKCNNKKDNNS